MHEATALLYAKLGYPLLLIFPKVSFPHICFRNKDLHYLRRPPEVLLEELVDSNSSPDLLLPLSRYLNTRIAVTSIITTLRKGLATSTIIVETNLTKPHLWLNVLDQAESYDLLNVESTLKLLLEHQPMDKVIEAINTKLPLSDRSGLIDLFHEVVYASFICNFPFPHACTHRCFG